MQALVLRMACSQSCDPQSARLKATVLCKQFTLFAVSDHQHRRVCAPHEGFTLSMAI